MMLGFPTFGADSITSSKSLTVIMSRVCFVAPMRYTILLHKQKQSFIIAAEPPIKRLTLNFPITDSQQQINPKLNLLTDHDKMPLHMKCAMQIYPVLNWCEACPQYLVYIFIGLLMVTRMAKRGDWQRTEMHDE